MKHHRLTILLLPLALSACADVLQGSRQSAINIRDDFKKTSENVKTYFVIPPYEKPVKKGVPERYCYRTIQDITCYTQPVLGAETRLVAYQGSVMENVPAPVASDSLKVDTAVMPVEITQGPQPTAPASGQMIIGDARDRAFDNRTPGEMKPIFIAPPPGVAATSDAPQEPAK